MTPPRLVQLQCPACAAAHWVIDSDCTGAHLSGMPELSYEERHYPCSVCAFTGAGYQVLQKSPPAFLLQPHSMYPMAREEFDQWVGILQTHFPDHPVLAKLGLEFVPYSPEQAEEDRKAFEAEHPVAWIRDQDGASRRNPQFNDGAEWLGMMVPDETLTFENRHGGRLIIRCRAPKAFIIDRTDDASPSVPGSLIGHTEALARIRLFFYGAKRPR